MQRYFTFLLFFLAYAGSMYGVEFGADDFFQNRVGLLKGEQVYLLTTTNSFTTSYTTIIDKALDMHKVFKVVALLTPEHEVDPKKVYTRMRYRETPIIDFHHTYQHFYDKKLPQGTAILIDLPPAPIRSFTYLATMIRALYFAHKKKLKCIILDRPNPLGGNLIDGPLPKKFGPDLTLCPCNIPYIHGMTLGEIALMVNKELKLNVHLTVIKAKGWKRSMTWNETHLPWIPPTKTLSKWETFYYTAITGVFDGLSCVRTTRDTEPFKAVRIPNIEGYKIRDVINARKIPGVQAYTKISLDSKDTSTHCWLHVDPQKIKSPLSVTAAIVYAIHLYQPSSIKKCLNYKISNKIFFKCWEDPTIKKMWFNNRAIAWSRAFKREVEQFKKRRAPYLLY